MGLESVANVTITSNSRGVTRAGFGTILVVAKHSKWPELVKEYAATTVLDDMVTDGFSTYDPAYRAVASAAAASPKVKTIKVGRLISAFNQIVVLSVRETTPIEGEVYAFTLRAPDGTTTAISYTVGASETQAEVATAIAALIDAVTDMGAAAITADITCTAANADEMWAFEDYDVEQFDFIDSTADETDLVTEITAMRNIDSDWYGLYLADCPSKARLLAIAAYAETLAILFAATTFDTGTNFTATTDDVMSAAQAADYFRTVIIFSAKQNRFAGCAWLGKMFPYLPGEATWAYKNLSGVTVDVLSTSRRSAIESKGGNHYTNWKGAPVTFTGKVASGEWVDVVRFRDWCVARLEEMVASLLVNNPKIPYTNKGADLLTTGIKGVLGQGIQNGGINEEEEITISHPDVSEVDDAYKIARLLPDVFFEATLAGAIHATNISGVLKV